jgi:hypothetical protein
MTCVVMIVVLSAPALLFFAAIGQIAEGSLRPLTACVRSRSRRR